MSGQSTSDLLRILRTAVRVSLNDYQGTGKIMVGCPPCPECGNKEGTGGTLLCHTIGCPVWDSLYGPIPD
jgi:hypothetical protein